MNRHRPCFNFILCMCDQPRKKYLAIKLFPAVKALNESCEFDVQCDGLAGVENARSPGAALCLGGVCSCGYNARAVGSPARCWHRRRPGQECRRDEVSYSRPQQA